MDTNSTVEDGVTMADKVDAANLSFPLARVKKIMKADADLGVIQSDALLAITAASEIFLEFLTEKAAGMSDGDKRKTVVYRDVANTVASDARLHFLQDLVPKTMPLLEALEYQRKKRAELGQQEEDNDDDEEGEAGVEEDAMAEKSKSEGIKVDSFQMQQ